MVETPNFDGCCTTYYCFRLPAPGDAPYVCEMRCLTQCIDSMLHSIDCGRIDIKCGGVMCGCDASELDFRDNLSLTCYSPGSGICPGVCITVNESALTTFVHCCGADTIPGTKTFTATQDFQCGLCISGGKLCYATTLQFYNGTGDSLHICGTNQLAGLGAPVNNTDAATKQYVDACVLTCDALYLKKSNNLSDVCNAATARSSLGLGVIATCGSIDISSNTNLAATHGVCLIGDTVCGHEAELNHCSLNCLSCDDHTQYLLANGNRTMTGDLNMGNKRITCICAPNLGCDAATKDYADGAGSQIRISSADTNNNYLCAKLISDTTLSRTIVNASGDECLCLAVCPANVPHDSLSGFSGCTHAQLTSHVQNTTNPHSVTPAQVNCGSAIWNACELQGYCVGTDVPADGYFLQYNGTNSCWMPVVGCPVSAHASTHCAGCPDALLNVLGIQGSVPNGAAECDTLRWCNATSCWIAQNILQVGTASANVTGCLNATTCITSPFIYRAPSGGIGICGISTDNHAIVGCGCATGTPLAGVFGAGCRVGVLGCTNNAAGAAIYACQTSATNGAIAVYAVTAAADNNWGFATPDNICGVIICGSTAVCTPSVITSATSTMGTICTPNIDAWYSSTFKAATLIGPSISPPAIIACSTDTVQCGRPVICIIAAAPDNNWALTTPDNICALCVIATCFCGGFAGTITNALCLCGITLGTGANSVACINASNILCASIMSAGCIGAGSCIIATTCLQGATICSTGCIYATCGVIGCRTVASGVGVTGCFCCLGAGCYGHGVVGCTTGEHNGTTCCSMGVIGSSANGTGVYGVSSNETGVYGLGWVGVGVHGYSAGSGCVGVFGCSSNATTGGAGVYGKAHGPGGQGITGYAYGSSGIGGWFCGSTTDGYGVFGCGYAGVVGRSLSGGFAAILGCGCGAPWAGYFCGNVCVTGSACIACLYLGDLTFCNRWVVKEDGDDLVWISPNCKCYKMVLQEVAV